MNIIGRWVAFWWPWLLAGLATGTALFGFFWLWWWWLPKWQVNHLRFAVYDPKARADVEDNFRKTLTQLFAVLATLFAGIVALLAAGIAYLQLFQQQKASHELLISNQVSKGFEQLGSDKPAIRLGGIYALEGVMNTSEEYHKPVLEALSAFVRDGTRTETGDVLLGSIYLLIAGAGAWSLDAMLVRERAPLTPARRVRP
jgi:L-asparagine transporter-like permease